MNKVIGILMLSAGVLAAQDAAEKATVPLHDPSRPASVHAHLLNGSLTVKGGDVKDVIVEARPRSGGDNRDSHPARADGMKRIDLPGGSGLDVVEDDNRVTIKTASIHRPVDLVITVPRRSSLELKCVNSGDIYAEQVEGDIDASNVNGKVTLKNVAGSVTAHSLNGEVLVTLDRIDPAKPMSFSTLNGDIDVTLPGAVKANVLMKTDHGEIYSDFEVKLNTAPTIAGNSSGRQPDGTYHLRFDHSLRGTIDGGGPEFQFTTFNGQIYIRRKK